MPRMTNPGRANGAAGTGMTFKAARLNVKPIHITFDGEMHHRLRVARLQAKRGLTNSRAVRPRHPDAEPHTITGPAFEGGATTANASPLAVSLRHWTWALEKGWYDV
jgi:hypothetical protein